MMADRFNLTRAGVQLILVAAISGYGAAARAAELRVDCAVRDGTIRPLHGLNAGPLCYGETVDLSAAWRELGVPITRLHDCEWPSGAVADMHAVFPDLAADPL